MNRITHFTAACLVVSCVLATPAFADKDEAAGFRIGVVNLKEIFDNYDKQTAEYEKLRIKRDELQTPIDKLSKQITEDKKQYDEERDTLSDDDRRALEEKIESALSEYKSEFGRAQEAIDRIEKRLIRDLFEEINIAIQEVGAKYNYHLIFEGSEAPAGAVPGRSGGLLYHSTTLNMTQRVIEHINAKYTKK